jgi:hypothetical protein
VVARACEDNIFFFAVFQVVKLRVFIRQVGHVLGVIHGVKIFEFPNRDDSFPGSPSEVGIRERS